MVLAPKLRPIVAFLCVLAGLPAAPALVDAWNADGHMIVAWIAYRHFTPPTRARVGALLQLNPQYNTWIAGLPAGSTADRRARRALSRPPTGPISSRELAATCPTVRMEGSRRQTRRPRRRTSATRIGTGTCTGTSSIRHSAMTGRRHTRRLFRTC